MSIKLFIIFPYYLFNAARYVVIFPNSFLILVICALALLLSLFKNYFIPTKGLLVLLFFSEEPAFIHGFSLLFFVLFSIPLISVLTFTIPFILFTLDLFCF